MDLEAAGDTLQELAAGALSDGDPSFEEVHFWLGEYWLQKDDRVKAREAFKTAVNYNPDFGKAKDGLAKAK
jgi:TolA-binding protein